MSISQGDKEETGGEHGLGKAGQRAAGFFFNYLFIKKKEKQSGDRNLVMSLWV